MSNTILRLPAVLQQSGYSRTSLYNRIAEGTWIRPIKLGANSVGWPACEVDILIDARIAGKNHQQLCELVKELELARKEVELLHERKRVGA